MSNVFTNKKGFSPLKVAAANSSINSNGKSLTPKISSRVFYRGKTMNSLCRSIAQIASSRCRRILLSPIFIQQSFSTSNRTKLQGFRSKTTAKTPQAPAAPPPRPPSSLSVTEKDVVHDWARPSEIPFQAKVVNSVHLIGYVQMPVQFQAASDGKFWAGTVITQNQTDDSPPVWIPIIFEGDLAHVAACHLKEHDHVYIEGQLSADPPPLSVNQGEANVQVMAKSINFVEGSFKRKISSAPHKLEDWTLSRPGTNFVSATIKEDKDSIIENKHSTQNYWREILDNSNGWLDFRDKKLNGQVKPNYPDFKRKDGSIALWLNRAPEWFLSELEGSNDNAKIPKSTQLKELKGENSWKDLVDNPDKWWDNRSNKLNVRSPDFKHKDTGEGLWLNDSPTWVLPKLPPVGSKKDTTFHRRDTLLS